MSLTPGWDFQTKETGGVERKCMHEIEVRFKLSGPRLPHGLEREPGARGRQNHASTRLFSLASKRRLGFVFASATNISGEKGLRRCEASYSSCLARLMQRTGTMDSEDESNAS